MISPAGLIIGLYTAVIALKLVDVIDWTWWAIFLPLWLPFLIGVFIGCVVTVHDAMSTPREREEARERRHHRNWGL